MPIQFPAKRVTTLVSACALFFISLVPAHAHPLGNFTINHYARLEPDTAQLRIRVLLDFAEIPTFQEKTQLDADRNGIVSDSERGAYLAARAPQWISQLRVTADGKPLAPELEPGTATLELSAGQGGLQTMRIAIWARAPLNLSPQGTKITFADENYAERLGWREIVARAGPGVTLLSSTVPAQDTTRELTNYPADRLDQPLAQRTAEFIIVPRGATVPAVTNDAAATANALGVLDRTQKEFGALLTDTREFSPWVLLVSFFAAMALGAVHAFSPGHGKAVVGAYLVGSRGTWKHALFLGLVVTVTHTAGVYVLGAVTLFLSAYLSPEQLYPWLGFISGVLVASIGARLFWQRARTARSFNPRAHFLEAHTHADGTTHTHSFASSADATAHAHEHAHAINVLEKPSRRNLLSLGISGGLVPCPSALVVMLSAIGLGRVGFGFFLIVGFSVGLASVLVATGLVLLYAGKYAGQKMRGARAFGLLRYVPLVSAVLVTLLGLALALDGLWQFRWFR